MRVTVGSGKNASNQIIDIGLFPDQLNEKDEHFYILHEVEVIAILICHHTSKHDQEISYFNNTNLCTK